MNDPAHRGGVFSRSAPGRKQPFKSAVFPESERPLLRKADIREYDPGNQNRAPKIQHLNDRYTPHSRHWATLILEGRF